MNFKKEEFEDSLKKIDAGVKDYITGLKKQSSEEILDGSVETAQSLISRIIPVETLYKKLAKTQTELLELINNQLNGGEESKADEDDSDNSESEEKTDTQKEEKKVEAPKKEDKISEQKVYRIPILKGLIYLGGSAEVPDVVDFIKRDMKNKFTESDLEFIRTKEDDWFKVVEAEKNIMKDEGLLSAASENESWEIVQKGIDYLAKNGK